MIPLSNGNLVGKFSSNSLKIYTFTFLVWMIVFCEKSYKKINLKKNKKI